MPSQSSPSTPRLGSRAREVLEALYRLGGEASVQQVLDEVDGLPSYSAARSVLRQLLNKGLVSRRERDFKYFYSPTEPRSDVSRSALVHLLETFFHGSPEKTMKALLDLRQTDEYEIDLESMERLVREALEEGR